MFTKIMFSSVVAAVIGRPLAQKQLLEDGRRWLSVLDDEAQSFCAPKLETFYACDGGNEDVADENERDPYYYADDDDFCAAIAEIECSVVEDECGTEYEAAVSCYSEAACGRSFSCLETNPSSPSKTVGSVAFYNVNPAQDEVCFEYGTSPQMSSKSGPVEFGETVLVEIDLTSEGIAHDLFVRVSDSCGEGPARIFDNIAQIYSSSSNLVGWGASSTSQGGYLQSLRRDDEGAAAYFLNEFSQESDCVFTWAGMTTNPVSLHEAATFDLTCADLEDIEEVSVECGSRTFASLEIVLDDFCADTSLHFVATATGTNDEQLTLRLFQAADKETCEEKCSPSNSKKKKSDDFVGMALIVGVIVVALALICACICCLRASSSSSSKKRKLEATAMPQANLERTSSI